MSEVPVYVYAPMTAPGTLRLLTRDLPQYTDTMYIQLLAVGATRWRSVVGWIDKQHLR